MDKLQYFETLSRSAVRANCDADHAAIARIAYDASEAGSPVSIWHAAATHFGFLDRCHCQPCSKARGES